jgi:hypothetical protein
MKKMNEEQTITIEEFYRLKQMIKSTDEDMDMAVEILKNLNVKNIYVILLGKSISLDKRSKFFKNFMLAEYCYKERHLNHYINLTVKNIKKIIKTKYVNDDTVKEVFNKELKEERYENGDNSPLKLSTTKKKK